ncbi:MAG: hypothetical protein RI894_1500 [Bacteroidota bacterium]|jgi:AcrR family transcriptional regulator
MDARQKILVAAEKLFAEHGFEGTSTRTLSQEAGVNLAMISYYFGSKEDLYKTLVTERTAPFRDAIESFVSLETTAWQKMELIIDGYVDRMFESSSLHKIIYRELSMDNSPIYEIIVNHISKNMQNVRRIIEMGIESGEFKPDVESQLVMPTITGTIVQVIKSPTLSISLLGLDPKTNSIFDEKHKNHLKKYLKSLIKSYLLN